MTASPMSENALMIIDVQRDFCKGGSLAVEESDYIFPSIRQWGETFLAFKRPIVYSLDYHPENTPHFDTWPVHCVAGTEGAKLDDRVFMHSGEDAPIYMVLKGLAEDDGYSAFSKPSSVFKYNFPDMPDKKESLLDVLLEEGVHTLYVVGLATDYCVKQTVLDALKLGFRVIVLLDGCAAVDKANEVEVWCELATAGAEMYYYNRLMNDYICNGDGLALAEDLTNPE